jgi:hypothetical protein
VAELIEVHHPAAGRTMTTTRRLYETVWSKSGWVEHAPAPLPVKPATRRRPRPKSSGTPTGASTRKKGAKPENKE